MAEGSDKSTTPQSLNFPEDKRKHPKAGVYPYYNVIYKGRDGSVIMGDSSEGAESLTIQGRGGEMVQMTDGSIRITSHNGMYTVVLGENRMYITGAQDVVIDGDASMRVGGNMRMHVDGDVEWTVAGDYTVTSKNMHQIIRGNLDTTAKNMSTKIEGSTEISTHGHMGLVGDTGVSLASTAGGIAIGAKADIAIAAVSDLKLQTLGKLSLKATGQIAMDGSEISLNSGDSVNAQLTHKPAKAPTA